MLFSLVKNKPGEEPAVLRVSRPGMRRLPKKSRHPEYPVTGNQWW
jgi:hypothetical protein